jgi:hypothetical protein
MAGYFQARKFGPPLRLIDNLSLSCLLALAEARKMQGQE